MDSQTKIEIAEGIYEKLIDIHRTEWNKWVQYFEKNGWDRALRLAILLSESPMIRQQPQETYKRIHAIMNQERAKLNKIYIENSKDIMEILGYISWKLIR